MLANKVDSDLAHVSLPANSKSVAQVSEMALLHTRNYLPNIKEFGAEMGELLHRSIEQKNSSIRNAVESLRSISNIESLISKVNGELDSLPLPKDGLDAFELVALVSRLPYVYSTLLVEAVRRREWAAKMTKDTSVLAEEMAGFQEEEERRRKRWLEPIADVVHLELVQGNMLGYLHEYLKVLQSVGLNSMVEPLRQAIKDMDCPKQRLGALQTSRWAAFMSQLLGKARCWWPATTRCECSRRLTRNSRKC